MTELRGMPVVVSLIENLSEDIKNLSEHGIIPTLAIVRVGGNEDDLSYERGALKRFSSSGAEIKVCELEASCTQDDIENMIISLNSDDSVHGILVFRPLPKHLSEDRIKNIISPEKDVDGMSPVNQAHVFSGDDEGYPPCTAQAVIDLLDYYKISLSGKNVTVIGRSLVVGRPLAMLLIKRNATVTVCHTKTVDTEKICRGADILIAAAGSAKMVGKSFVNPSQTVIDVGINFVDGKMCGDADYDAIAEEVSAITPVPGGVGTVTTSVLLKHTICAAKMQK